MVKIVSTGRTLSLIEYHEKRKRIKRKRSLIFLGIVLVLLIALVFASRLEKLRIQNVSVSGSQVISPEKVTAVVEDLLSGHYLWLVPHDNALFYPKGTIETVLARKFPRFSSIAVSLQDLQTLEVLVAEREPFALYCSETTPSSGGCYFLDEEGYIFDEAPTFSSGVYFIYSPESHDPEPLGKAFLPTTEFRALYHFIDELKTLGITGTELEVQETDFAVTFNGAGRVMWSREAELPLIFSNLEAFLNAEEIRAQADFLERVETLDLRTENKVFYTFREEI